MGTQISSQTHGHIFNFISLISQYQKIGFMLSGFSGVLGFIYGKLFDHEK